MKGKRLLSVLLIAVLTFTLLPAITFPASADEPTAENY
jgi:hypothetical protein